GSEKSISILELATLISSLTCNKGVEISDQVVPASNYVPSTTNFRNTYTVDETVALDEGLRWWIDWISSGK
ncbi:MAG: hypothetical protein NTY85_06735, partial [Actinobacteria bacterium]|nr:hypothetical protein [Actinomycetota bacterium]